jgi:aspartyl-tRNA(Asn)/glutamyl-tRNA(Gln) amidotransferase subunit B
VPLAPTEAMLQEAREALPELPAARIERYEAMGLAADVAAKLAADPETAAYFERTLEEADGVEAKVVANWVTGELAAALRQGEEAVAAADSKVEPNALATLVAMVQGKKISHGNGKTVLAALVAEGGDPAAIVEREGLAQIADSGELESIVAAAIAANPEAAGQIRAGNGKAIGAIVGAVMKETKGRADGGEVNRLINAQLGS